MPNVTIARYLDIPEIRCATDALRRPAQHEKLPNGRMRIKMQRNIFKLAKFLYQGSQLLSKSKEFWISEYLDIVP